MKKLVMFILALCLGISVFASGKEWLTNLEDAMKLSQKTGKPILVDFSGSDWCGWCIKLDREVFSQKAFKDFAKENLILVMIDFPRKSNMTPKQKKANRALSEKYNIEGFPTVLLLDGKGKVIVRTGYQDGGAKKYVEYLKSKMPVKKTEEAKK